MWDCIYRCVSVCVLCGLACTGVYSMWACMHRCMCSMWACMYRCVSVWILRGLVCTGVCLYGFHVGLYVQVCIQMYVCVCSMWVCVYRCVFSVGLYVQVCVCMDSTWACTYRCVSVWVPRGLVCTGVHSDVCLCVFYVGLCVQVCVLCGLVCTGVCLYGFYVGLYVQVCVCMGSTWACMYRCASRCVSVCVLCAFVCPGVCSLWVCVYRCRCVQVCAHTRVCGGHGCVCDCGGRMSLGHVPAHPGQTGVILQDTEVGMVALWESRPLPSVGGYQWPALPLTAASPYKTRGVGPSPSDAPASHCHQ
ncbi:uncharacterized protein LOC127560449 [Antechinus flavipes]|uniref:uncharacterized protein LOC127560449 n=1 Tax=Antechinus flavipes TaxID=38775 RepID=UPI0022365A70|nr:uncharacterized protein LOC127560449 [Antechinus flavipes]